MLIIFFNINHYNIIFLNIILILINIIYHNILLMFLYIFILLFMIFYLNKKNFVMKNNAYIMFYAFRYHVRYCYFIVINL